MSKCVVSASPGSGIVFLDERYLPADAASDSAEYRAPLVIAREPLFSSTNPEAESRQYVSAFVERLRELI